jgi:CBS domain-containing protein
MKSDVLRGFVDIYEIMAYTAFSDSQPVDWKRPASVLLGTMGNIVDDDVCGVWVVKEQDSLHKPLEWLSKGVRRFLVETKSGWRLVSQSDMAKFLWRSYDKFSIGELSLTEAAIIRTPVIRVDTQTTVMDAFKKTRIQEVNGIAVTDSAGTLMATLSESDLRGLTMATMSRLQLNVIDFLTVQNMGVLPEVVTVSANMSLRNLLETFAKKKLHRVFVVDGENRLTGIITLTDIIGYFWQVTMKYWYSTE